MRLNPLQKIALIRLALTAIPANVIDSLTYRSEFFIVTVLKVFEELTSCLILFEGQLKHLGLARVLLYASTQ